MLEGVEAPPPGAAGAGTEEKFDPDLAMRFLKWREEKKRARAKGGIDGRYMPREPSLEEMQDEVLGRLAAIRRQRQAQQMED